MAKYYEGVFEGEYLEKNWRGLMKEIKPEGDPMLKTINFEEYCKLITERLLAHKSIFVALSDKAFGTIDDDGGGSITEVEFRAYMSRAFNAMEITLVWDYMLSFDEDEDREIDGDEFADLIDYLYEPYTTKIMNNFDFWATLVPLVCKLVSILLAFFLGEESLISEVFEQIEGFADILFLVSALSQLYESEIHTDLLSKLMLLHPVQDAAKKERIRQDLKERGLIGSEIMEGADDESASSSMSSDTRRITEKLLSMYEKTVGQSQLSDDSEQNSKDKNDSTEGPSISPKENATNDETKDLMNTLINRFAKENEDSAVAENNEVEDKKNL